MHTVRDLNGVLVVSLALQRSITPSTSNLAENLATVSDKLGVRNGKSGNSVGIAEGARERAVEEVAAVGAGSSGPWGVLVTSLVSNEREDVGTNIPATESVQVPVCLYGANLGVVVVVLGVGGADKLLGYRVTEKNTEDLVLQGVGMGLIKCDKDERVLHEVLVSKKRLQKVARPGTGSGDTSIVAVGSPEVRTLLA